MCPNPGHACICPSPLRLPHRKEKERLNLKTEKKLSQWNLCMSWCVTYYTPQSTLFYLQMFVAVSHWSRTGHYHYRMLTRTPLGYPVVIQCHGDPVALDLQDRTGPFMLSNSTWMGWMLG